MPLEQIGYCLLCWKKNGYGSRQGESNALLGAFSYDGGRACKICSAGNTNRAYKHLIIGAKSGCKDSLAQVKFGFMDGDVTKEEYENTACLP